MLVLASSNEGPCNKQRAGHFRTWSRPDFIAGFSGHLNEYYQTYETRDTNRHQYTYHDAMIIACNAVCTHARDAAYNHKSTATLTLLTLSYLRVTHSMLCLHCPPRSKCVCTFDLLQRDQ